MREIKFRAWDKTNKIMYPRNKDEFIVVGNNICYLYCGDDSYFGACVIEFENVEIMQYTGVKDKNDKEIYEGDIIKAKTIFGDVVALEVAYNPYSNGLGAKYYDLDDSFPEDIRKKGYVFVSLITYEDIEILGNIYENPELLKEVKENDN